MNGDMQEKIAEIITGAQRVLVIQADNPDADSLGSALALEHILSDMGKDVALYCGVHIPDYLHYLPGWDRVLSDVPSNFDLSIIVDASTYILLEKLEASGHFGWVKSRPCIVLDHHVSVEKPLDFTEYMLVRPDVASTGELIFTLASANSWPVNPEAAGHIMMSILGDTQGLTNELTSASTYRVMADLTDLGADRTALEEARREYGKMLPKIYAYKAKLINETTFAAEGKIAYVAIGQADLNEFSPLYNPVPLIQPDMLQVKDVALALVFKIYDDGKVTGAIRTNNAYPVAAKLAEAMGGGGHPHASGFKVTDGTPFEEVKTRCLETAHELLEAIDTASDDTPVVHQF
jgi:phosphoesterase RecJ-like protein